MNGYDFNYFYGEQSEQFAFYRFPKALIMDARFKNLSNNAKILYGLMLDRMSLSRKCGWLDDCNRVYIKYSRNKIAEDLNIGKDTAGNLLKDLVEFGLIEMIQEPGKANIIFVKNFVTVKEVASEQEECDERQSHSSTIDKNQGQSEKSSGLDFTPVEKINQSKIASGSMIQPEEKNNQTKMSEGTGGKVSLVLEGKSDTINTKYNTDKSDTKIISIHQEKLDQKDGWIDGKLSEAECYLRLIKKNLSYDDYMTILPVGDQEMFDELFDIICDIVCVPRDFVRVDGRDYPYSMVKSRFLKLKGSHLEYVIDSLRNCTTDITNIRSYLITALYNAPCTINNYYTARVNHDLYGSRDN